MFIGEKVLNGHVKVFLLEDEILLKNNNSDHILVNLLLADYY